MPNPLMSTVKSFSSAFASRVKSTVRVAFSCPLLNLSGQYLKISQIYPEARVFSDIKISPEDQAKSVQ